MFLYELAIELGERSTDVCEKAETLGIGTLLSTSELTRDQVAAIRAAYHRPPPGGVTPPAAPGAPPAAWGAPPPEPSGAPGGAGTGSRAGQFAAIGLVVAVVLAGFGYMVVNAGPDEERQQAISQDLAEWNDAPAVTVDPKVAAAAAKQVPSDQPVDEAKLCAAQDVMYDTEIRMNHDDSTGTDPADLAIWRKAVDDMAKWGPADAKDDIAAYRDALLVFYDTAARVGLGKARPQFDAVKAAEDQMYPQIIPFCGYPGD